MSLISRLFGRKGPGKPVEEMSLFEVASFLKDQQSSMVANDLIAVARRVTDIALYDHGVAEQERAVAFGLLPALDDDIQEGLRDQPGAWEAYQEAAAYHRGNARHCGYGSLQWKMEEEGIPTDKIIPYIARADHAELLPAMLEMFEPDVIGDIRGGLLAELSTARAQSGERPLDVLSRLAGSEDGALTQLLAGSQLGALRRAQTDPEPAKQVLQSLGVNC